MCTTAVGSSGGKKSDAEEGIHKIETNSFASCSLVQKLMSSPVPSCNQLYCEFLLFTNLQSNCSCLEKYEQLSSEYFRKYVIFK